MTQTLRCLIPVIFLLLTQHARADDAYIVNNGASKHIQLASVSVAVQSFDSDLTLYEKNADFSVPIASITKLMTAMVVLDSDQSLDEWIKIEGWEARLKKNTYSRLRIGSEAKRGELLQIALMSSENLASHTLARHYPGGLDAFIEAMNAKAQALNMQHSRFDDPTGLSTGNRASAGDLQKMIRAAYDYESIRKFSTTYQHAVRFKNPRYNLNYGNTNPLTASSRWDVALSKTGYLTEAGRCLVMVTIIDEQPVGIVLLNSFGTRTPLGDAGRIRRWLLTGDSGKVAGAALEYEKRQSKALLEKASLDQAD